MTLRDQGIPLPAGAILISPWVDLTHSFPSVGEDNPLDYIPPSGFHHRPSPSWPPPNSDDIAAIQEAIAKNPTHSKDNNPPLPDGQAAVEGLNIDSHPTEGTANQTASSSNELHLKNCPVANTIPGPGHNLSMMLDGKLIEVKDQIHMYATNQLLSHPLVSPIFQPSLGGLPPLLITVGGGEMLRDEQIYVAHKAANPTKYPPPDIFLDRYPSVNPRDVIAKWKPTDVQLQVWDNLCHVAPTLSFTRPAKYMYRSIAQFGAWALARAQKTEIEILDDDDVSIISTSSSSSNEENERLARKDIPGTNGDAVQVGKAGDSLPPFKNHMIRQRVDPHGNIFPLDSPHQLRACTILPSEIGVIKEGPVRKWMETKRKFDTKYASEKRRVQKQRARDMAQGYMTFGEGEVPPPSALAGRRKTGSDLAEEKRKRSLALSLWALWGSKHDEKTIEKVQEADQVQEAVMDPDATAPSQEGRSKERRKSVGKRKKSDYSRSRSRRRVIADEHQTEASDDVDENTPAAEIQAKMEARREQATTSSSMTTDQTTADNSDVDGNGNPEIPHIIVRTPTLETELKRPKLDGIAFPFSLKGKDHGRSDSMKTLTSDIGVSPMPLKDEGAGFLHSKTLSNGDVTPNQDEDGRVESNGSLQN